MSLTVTNKGGTDFEPVTAGVHLAVCIWIIDLGSEWSEMFGKWQRRVLLTWETVDETISLPDENGVDQDRRRVISKSYTPSLNSKATLRADLTSWRGRDFTPEEEAAFDLRKILGVACQLNVVHTSKNNKTYANIKAIIPAVKGTKLTAENPLLSYDIDQDGLNIPEGLPQWVKDKITKSQEYQALQHPGNDQTGAGEEEQVQYDTDIDSIPF